MNTAAAATLQTIRVLCTNGLKTVFEALEDDIETRAGAALAAEYGSTRKFTDRIAAGDVPDLAILTDEAIDGLIAQGKLAGPRIDVAKSFIGVAVRIGTPKPDISTPDAFVRALRGARAISRSRQGASGIHFAALLDTLGLTQELGDRIKVYDGYAGQACAEGQVDIAIQQISELMPVAGLDIVGPLPVAYQKVTMFSAALGAGTTQAAAANAVLATVRDAANTALLRAKGLEPA